MLGLLALFVPAAAAQAPPVAHHPGVWTTAAPWPGRDADFSNSVWAVHMALLRGDTLFARPHSQVLTWGSWYEGSTDGGLWAWNPATDLATATAQNLVEVPVERPPLNPFCAGHATLPNGDLLIVGGTERDIVGEMKSARFRHLDRQWVGRHMTANRWYANATPLADGRILATAGIRYDHMVLFGGRKQTGGALTSDVQRYAITSGGAWDASLVGAGAGWPAPREHHTLAEQANGPYYLFGGRGVDSLFNDFWQLRLQDDDQSQSYTWQRFTTGDFVTSLTPPRRWRHVAVVDPDSLEHPAPSAMYVHGGDDGATPPAVMDDLWKLEPVTTPQGQKWRWTSISQATGPGPGKRTGHTAVWDEQNTRMILFGGEGEAGALTDANVYVLAFPSGVPAWRIAPLAAGSDPAPMPRTLHAMAADFVPRNPAGIGASGSWFHAVVFGGRRADGLTNELYELFVEPTTDSVKWIRRTPSGPAPAARGRASLVVYEEYPGSAVVMGGELASGAWDSQPWEIDLLTARPWRPRAAVSDAVRGHTAFREQRPLTALRPELYDPGTDQWSEFGPLRWQTSYHLTGLASDGKLYHSGANTWGTDTTWRLDPAQPTPTWSPYAVASSDPLDDTITGVLYRPDALMKCGGTDNSSPGAALALATAKSLPLGVASPAWKLPVNGGMGLSRIDHYVNMLPTGEVLAAGGVGKLTNARDGNPDNDDARKRPEIWEPDHVAGDAVGWWYGALSDGSLQLAEEPVARGHHSSTVLLPDGRLLSGGGWDVHPDAVRRSVDQYSPPYLFRPAVEGGAAAFRPRLYGAQDHIPYDADFKVACPDGVAEACLIRPGATTHSFNQDNRFVPLAIVSQPAGSHQVTLRSPVNADHAPPGNYLLFVLRDDNGRKVPSIARWVNVGTALPAYATWDTLPPVAIHDLLVTGVTATSHTLQWTAPADAGDGSSGRATRYELRYRSGSEMPTLEDFFTHGTSVVGLPEPAAAGTPQTVTVTHPATGQPHYFRIISRDGAGSDRNWSGLGNQAETPPCSGPFVDTWTVAGWASENSILDRSPTGEPSLDGYRLRHAPEASGGRVRLRVRENDQQRSTLDQVRLVAVDHAPGVRAHALGEDVVIGTRVAAARVRTAAGVDVTARLGGTAAGFAGRPGDTLWVEFAAAARAEIDGERNTTRDHELFLLEDEGKCPPDSDPALFRPEGRPVGSRVPAASGIQVQVQDTLGGWRTVLTRHPRVHADETVLDRVGHGPVRLVFLGRHTLHFVGRLNVANAPHTARELPLRVASHSRTGDVAAALDTTDKWASELTAGDTLDLEFDWPPVPAGQLRELLLLTHGAHPAAPPDVYQPVPERFAVAVPRPNPFATSTTLQFDLPVGRHVRLEVLDAQGRRVRVLANHWLSARSHSIEWDGCDEAGSRTRPGLYFYRLEAGEFRARGRMSRVR